MTVIQGSVRTLGLGWSLALGLLLVGVAWWMVAGWWQLAIGLALAVTLAVAWWRRTAFSRLRRENQGDGWADRATVRQAGSRVRADSPDGGAGTLLGHTVVGSTGKRVHAPHRGTVGIVGGPGSGKTLELGRAVRRHPGAAVVSSSRLDLHDATVSARRELGPVFLFNPEGMDGRPSSMRWTPLTGCTSPSVASERAAALIAATDSGAADDRSWLDSAASVLAGFLLAAALDGRDMADVHRWTTDYATRDTCMEWVHVLANHPSVPAGWLEQVAGVLMSKADKMTASVMRPAALAVGFMADPTVARTCCPQPGEPQLDVVDLIEKRGTLYLVGSHREYGSVTPLLAALTTHLFDVARRHASTKPRGRLAPALLMALDEVRVTASVPLDVWTSYAGGHGIHIVWASQDFAQLRERWNQNGADTIVDNTTHLLVYGGLSCNSDLEGLSVLCGEQRVTIAGEDGKTERKRVMPADRIAQLPTFHALLLSRSKPVILRTAGVPWRKPDWRAAKAWLMERGTPSVTTAVVGPPQLTVVRNEEEEIAA